MSETIFGENLFDPHEPPLAHVGGAVTPSIFIQSLIFCGEATGRHSQNRLLVIFSVISAAGCEGGLAERLVAFGREHH